jgi:hypothetical protein
VLHPIEWLHWLETRLNRPSPRGFEERAFWSLFSEQGVPLQGPPPSLSAACPAPELLIVVTTYRRERACQELLDMLRAALDQTRLSYHVLIFNDASDSDYAACRAHARSLFPSRVTWLDACARLGKPGFWRVYQTAFLAARTLAPGHALFLQDDIEIAPDLLQRVFALWQLTESDPLRRVLYLFSSVDDERTGRWIYFRRVQREHGLRLTQWFDLQAFFVDRSFFELLQYRIVPIHPNRFRRTPNKSSGVGKQLTLRLRFRASVYQTFPAYALHGAHPSEMNEQARKRRPLDNRGERRVPTRDEP